LIPFVSLLYLLLATLFFSTLNNRQRRLSVASNCTMTGFDSHPPARSARQPSTSLLSQQLGKSMPIRSNNTQSFYGSPGSRSIKDIKTVHSGTNFPFKLESREDYLKENFGGSKKEFMKHFRLPWGIYGPSFSLPLAKLIFLLGDEAAQEEANVMIDRMRGQPDGHGEIVIQRSDANRTRSQSEAPKYENLSEKYGKGSPEFRPYYQMSSSHQDDLLFPMEEDIQYIETPAQRRAIQEDMSPLHLRRPPSTQQHHAPRTPVQQHSSSRVQAQVQQPAEQRPTPRAQLVYMDYGTTRFPPRYFREDDKGNSEYGDDSDGFHDMSGFEDGSQHYNDFHGEYDGGYGDY
jgi:hypothetical protein